jgi:hypothetical protein
MPSFIIYVDDLGEQDNLAASHPVKVEELNGLLKDIMEAGRSRPD